MSHDNDPKSQRFLHPLEPGWGAVDEEHTNIVTANVLERHDVSSVHGIEEAIRIHSQHQRQQRIVHEQGNIALLRLTDVEMQAYVESAGQPDRVADNVLFLQRKAVSAFEHYSDQTAPDYNKDLARIRKITLEMLGCVQKSWHDTKELDDAIWFLPEQVAARDGDAPLKIYDYDEDFAINCHTKYSAWPIINRSASRTTYKNLAFVAVQRRRATLDYRNVQVFKESTGLIAIGALPSALGERLSRVFVTPDYDKDPEEAEWAVATAGILFFNASRQKDDTNKFVTPTSSKILASAIRQEP